MNGVLPALTWGTWDEVAWPINTAACAATCVPVPVAAECDHSTISTTSNCTNSSKSARKLRQKRLSRPTNDLSVLWFEELLERLEQSDFGTKCCYYQCNALRCLHTLERSASHSAPIPWSRLPPGIHPRDGQLSGQRARNKRLQVENLVFFLAQLLRPGDVVVEFCAGSGYVALPLAYMFPACTFVLLDKKEPSLAIAQQRIDAAKLQNVRIFNGFVNEFVARFDVGIALHACGEATDMVLQKCIDQRASYVVAPCCVGKIKSSDLTFPRSSALQALLTRQEFEVIAKAADFGHSNQALAMTERNQKRRKCKSMLESDRTMQCVEAQYKTWMFVMTPHDATPKNDILVGIPFECVGERCIELPCEQRLQAEALVRALFG